MDKYDEAIEYFTKFPGEISLAWEKYKIHPHGCLFQMAGDDTTIRHGCLTMIKGLPETYQAQTPELTAAILADERIPERREKITPQNLHVFAEWQRKIDQMDFRRKYVQADEFLEEA